MESSPISLLATRKPQLSCKRLRTESSLVYKGKEVDAGIKMDDDGNYLFEFQNDKISHVKYVDGVFSDKNTVSFE